MATAVRGALVEGDGITVPLPIMHAAALGSLPMIAVLMISSMLTIVTPGESAGAKSNVTVSCSIVGSIGGDSVPAKDTLVFSLDSGYALARSDRRDREWGLGRQPGARHDLDNIERIDR